MIFLALVTGPRLVLVSALIPEESKIQIRVTVSVVLPFQFLFLKTLVSIVPWSVDWSSLCLFQFLKYKTQLPYHVVVHTFVCQYPFPVLAIMVKFYKYFAILLQFLLSRSIDLSCISIVPKNQTFLVAHISYPVFKNLDK